MLERLSMLDSVRLNFSEGGLFVLNLTLAFIMFGVALGIKPEHFKRVATKPKPVVIGVISQFLFLPAITFLFVLLLNKVITPTVAMGMILVASCPGGNISNFISSLAKGNAALSVSLTAIATLAAIFMTPLNFSLWGRLYMAFAPGEASALLQDLVINPVEMFKTVFILLGIPLAIGMWFNHRFPMITDKIIRPIRNISIVIFLALVVVMFSNNYEFFIQHIFYIFIIVLFHNALALSTGFTAATVFKVNRSNRRSISIETGIQNSGLALVLLFNPRIFPESLENGGMAFVAAWWGIWHILAGMAIAWIWSRIPLSERVRFRYFLPKKYWRK